MTNKIKLNHNCPICKKEIILWQDMVTKNNVNYHLECYLNNCLEEKKLNKIIDEAIDFGDFYPIWMNLINKESKSKEDIPKGVYNMLDSFWKEQKKVIKEELKQKISEISLEEEK